MAQPSSISFDEVLGLLRGAAVQEFEAKYVADRGYALHDTWGNSQETMKHLQFAQFTREWIEQTLVSRGDLVGRFWDGVLDAEPDDDSSETPVVLMRGFSIVAACSIGLLERSDAELVNWLKFRRVLNHKNYAKDLRTIFSRL
jgi:hypothetical protein